MSIVWDKILILIAHTWRDCELFVDGRNVKPAATICFCDFLFCPGTNITLCFSQYLNNNKTPYCFISQIFANCSPHEFQCDSTTCIPNSELCDNNFDCTDMSDELPANCKFLLQKISILDQRSISFKCIYSKKPKKATFVITFFLVSLVHIVLQISNGSVLF